MTESRPSRLKPSIGIDLGTTYSCMAVFQNGRPEVIANSQGDRITPSVVAFTKEGRLVGEGAAVQRKLDLPSVIYNAKRFIGRTWDDPVVQENASQYPFKIRQKNNRVQLQADWDSKAFDQTPEEVAAAVLSKMKKIAEDYLEESVEDVVITVPAYFTDSQRQATKDAGEIAGLNVIRIINEPTAAAMAYGLREGSKEFEGRHVLVYDVGGGTFDVSVLEVENDLIIVEATAGNTNLGGEDFTAQILRNFKNEIFRKHGVDITPNHKAVARLAGACEKLKRNLSAENVTESKMQLDAFLPDGSDFECTLTRAKFENICKVLFDLTIKGVEKVLKDANLMKEDIYEVVLVGGSSRIPKLQSLLSEFFNINNNSSDKILNKSINPDEAVACGAAIQAAILNNDPHVSVKDMLLMDVNPLSIGINLLGDITRVVVERNTVLPVKKPFRIVTSEDEQAAMRITITEGERAMTKDNTILGSFVVEDLPLLKAGEAKIDLEFSLDANGILTVSATVRDTGMKAGITLDTSTSGRRSAEEVNELIQKAKMMKLVDEAQENRALTMNKLTALCHHIKLESQDYSETELGNLLTMTKDCISWIKDHPDANEEPLLLRYENLKYKASKCSIQSVTKEATKRSDHVLRMDKLTSTFSLKRGRELLKNYRDDHAKATEWFQKAYTIAREMGRLDKTIEALQCLGHAHRMLIEYSSDNDSQQLRINRAISTVSTLTSALDLEKNYHLENEARKEVIQDIKFAVDEFFEMIKEIEYEEISSPLKRFMRAIDNSSSIKNSEWLQIAFQCRYKEIQLVLKKVKECMGNVNYKAAQMLIKDLNYPKEQAKKCARSEVENDKLKKLFEVIQMHSSHAQALKQLDEAEEILEGVSADDPDAIDKALLALDHLSDAKLLSKEKHKQVYIKASFFEGKIFMDLVMYKEKAKSCFQEIIQLSENNECNPDQLKESEFLLEQLQADIEKAKGHDVNKEKLRKELEMELQKLKDADSRMTDEEFCIFIFSEFPPKHKENYKKPEMTGNPLSKKRAYIRFSTFYHPDKVDASLHGDKYKIRCEEISQCINGRYSKM